MSAALPECVLFAGPSGCGVTLALDGIDLRPPARRGDIDALRRSSAPGVVAVADGVFHQALAVGHAELREAVSAGWQVWGLSSIGAIRACEMRHLGVRGYGAVYRQFVADADFADDEVALAHTAEPPYLATSEPLIHLRLGLQALVGDGVISAAERRVLIARLKRMWYGERTLGFVRASLVEARPGSAPAVNAWIGSFLRYRVKSLDLQQFLIERPWRDARSRDDDRRSPDRKNGSRSRSDAARACPP